MQSNLTLREFGSPLICDLLHRCIIHQCSGILSFKGKFSFILMVTTVEFDYSWMTHDDEKNDNQNMLPVKNCGQNC